MKCADCIQLALELFDKHKTLHPSLTEYTGIVSLHGLARLALLTGHESIFSKARTELEPFLTGQRTWKANFPNY